MLAVLHFGVTSSLILVHVFSISQGSIKRVYQLIAIFSWLEGSACYGSGASSAAGVLSADDQDRVGAGFESEAID